MRRQPETESLAASSFGGEWALAEKPSATVWAAGKAVETAPERRRRAERERRERRCMVAACGEGGVQVLLVWDLRVFPALSFRFREGFTKIFEKILIKIPIGFRV